MKQTLIILFLALATAAHAQNYKTFKGCPVGGKPKSHDDSMKNRYVINDHYIAVDFKELFKLRRDDGMPAKNVKFRGYCLLVKDGGHETCNCQEMTDKTMWDTHIEIVESNSVDQVNTNAIVCEVNSRIRDIMDKQGVDWSTKALKATMEGHMVEIGGYGFFDSKHHWPNSVVDNPNGGNLWRHTTFEVHPVTCIKILD